jgi:Arc/MetJ-type ribon-helix-helix transcriptional regulator
MLQDAWVKNMKIASAHITLPQLKVMNYLREIDVHPSDAELIRVAIRFMLHKRAGLDNTTAVDRIDPRTFFKHVSKNMAAALWEENLETVPCQLQSMNLSQVVIGWLDMIAGPEDASRSDLIRIALHDFLRKELVVLELMTANKVIMKPMIKAIPTKNKGPDMRRFRGNRTIKSVK